MRWSGSGRARARRTAASGGARVCLAPLAARGRRTTKPKWSWPVQRRGELKRRCGRRRGDAWCRRRHSRRYGRRTEQNRKLRVLGRKTGTSGLQTRNLRVLGKTDSLLERPKLKFSYNNLKFGQNKSCRGREDLQLCFWAKVELRLGSRRKTWANTAKMMNTMQLA